MRVLVAVVATLLVCAATAGAAAIRTGRRQRGAEGPGPPSPLGSQPDGAGSWWWWACATGGLAGRKPFTAQ